MNSPEHMNLQALIKSLFLARHLASLVELSLDTSGTLKALPHSPLFWRNRTYNKCFTQRSSGTREL